MAQALVWAAGAAEALLLARLLARLLAARPDSPAIAMLYALTWPLVAPLSSIDASQRHIGAVLEFASIITAIAIPVVGYLLWVWLAHRTAATSGAGPSS